MDDSRTIERTAAQWLARRESGAWSARDQQALEAWLEQRTEHRVAWLRLHAAWEQAGRLRALAAGLPPGQVPERGRWAAWAAGDGAPAASPVPDLRALRFAPRPPPRPARWPRRLAACLALAMAAGAGWGAWQLSGRQQAHYASAVGQVREVALADGSRATLSSGTRLAVYLDRGQRRVVLEQGEALFEVARDPARPFAVEAGGYRAVAVGTRYAVRREAGALRVVVTEGRVRLEDLPGAGAPRPVSLLPAGSVATAGGDGVLVRNLPVEEAQRYLEWRDGFLVFDDTPLEQAAAEFNRFNLRRLELADPAVAALRVGGHFRWSNLDAFVGLLEQGFPVRAERHPDRIVLYAR